MISQMRMIYHQIKETWERKEEKGKTVLNNKNCYESIVDKWKPKQEWLY